MEFEIIISEEHEKLLKKKAKKQGISVEKLLENAIRKFLERNNGNGNR